MSDVLQGKISCPCQKMKSDSQAIQSAAYLLHQLCHSSDLTFQSVINDMKKVTCDLKKQQTLVTFLLSPLHTKMCIGLQKKRMPNMWK
jgi:hypothetical protein